MTSSAPPGWYPDPEVPGGQRYFNGLAWTEHRLPPAPYPAAPYPPTPWGPPPWKGAQLGRPADGPGALANPGRRLGARLLDGVLFLPVFAGLATIAILVVAPHAGPIFPRARPGPNASNPVPGFVWIELAVFGAFFAAAVLAFFYEAVMTARYGRTLGKAWLHIRPVRVDGTPLRWGASFGRAAVHLGANALGWIWLLDVLWCLWDGNRQCLHDKVVNSIVVNDPV